MNCKICENNIADKKGSHIIPQLLLDPVLGKRDNEQGFQIDDSGIFYFFGRSVLPETLEGTLGREIEDNDIEENSNPFIYDDVFCTSCEKKLSFLESLYSRRISSKSQDLNSLSELDKKIFYFFWLTTILRCSIVNFAGFRLDTQVEQNLKLLVNNVLANSEQDIEKNCQQLDFDYSMTILSNRSSDYKTRNCILLHPYLKDPYLIVINDFVVLLCTDNKIATQQILSEIGINGFSDSDDKLSVETFNDVERESLIQYCNKIRARQSIVSFKNQFIESYTKKKGAIPSDCTIDSYMQELINTDNVNINEKYSLERRLKLTNKYIDT